ncbi:MAG: aquaporin [Candidatus Saccharibacteria bacterium]|nr:aquaporin [Candidatus Saccharibacteria bacterium]
MFSRKNIAMVVAEFLGAATLVAAVYTIMARTSFPLFSAMAAGGVVALFTLGVGRASGAHLNPAITFGLWSVRRVQTARALVMIAAQFAGGAAAWALLKYFLGHSLTSIAGTEFEWKVFVAEAVGTGIFAFGFASAVMQRFDEAKLAAGIGLSLFIGVLVASLASNGVLNPAVAVGIQSWSWAYAAAPFAGALVGMNVYSMLFADASALSASASVASSVTRSSKKSAAKAAPKRKTTATRRKK